MIDSVDEKVDGVANMNHKKDVTEDDQRDVKFNDDDDEAGKENNITSNRDNTLSLFSFNTNTVYWKDIHIFVN